MTEASILHETTLQKRQKWETNENSGQKTTSLPNTWGKHIPMVLWWLLAVNSLPVFLRNHESQLKLKNKRYIVRRSDRCHLDLFICGFVQENYQQNNDVFKFYGNMWYTLYIYTLYIQYIYTIYTVYILYIYTMHIIYIYIYVYYIYTIHIIYTISIYYIYILYIYYIYIHYIYILYLYTISIYYIYILYLYTISIYYIYILYIYYV